MPAYPHPLPDAAPLIGRADPKYPDLGEPELRAGRCRPIPRLSAGVAYYIATDVRFWSRVDTAASGCWLWRGAPSKKGYGTFARTKHDRCLAHRYLWERDNGSLPPGRILLHRCDVPNCVNPQHLRLGTRADNNRDMYAKGRDSNQFANRVACPNGHPYTETSTWRTGRGWRQCRICRNERQRANRRTKTFRRTIYDD